MIHGINGIDLSQMMVMKPGAAKMKSVVKYALAGNPIVFEDTLPTAGCKTTLYGEGDRGTLLFSVIWQLEELANVPNMIYPAVISEKERKVRFCNEEPPAITYTPVLDSPIPKPEHRVHSIQIKLMIME